MAIRVGEKGSRAGRGAVAAIAATALLIAGCGGGSSKTSRSASGGLQPTAANGGPGSSVAPGVAGNGGGAPSSSVAANGRAAAGKGGANGSSTPGGASGGQGSNGPAAAQPGTYKYAQTGTYKQGPNSGSVPPEGSLVIDSAAPNGTQLWHRFVSPGDQPADSTLLFNPSGMFIQSIVERFGGIAVTCVFAPPLPAPPWPPTVGRTFATQGNCTGQGVNASISVDGNITGTDSLPLDGQSVSVYVANSTVKIDGTYQGKKVQATDVQTDWFAPSLRLSIKTHSVLTATYVVFTVSSDTTSTLESGRPT